MLRHPRTPAAAALLALIAVLAAACTGGLPLRPTGLAPRPAPPPEGVVEVHVLDVGQGDAALVRTAEGDVLIDTGTHQADDVVPALHEAGVTGLDLVVVTHPHADHLGQLDRVLAAFDVAEVWWSGAVHTTATFERALRALEASDAAYDEPRAGDDAAVAGLRIDVLNPPEPPAAAGSGDLDDTGIAVRIALGARSLLATGDMSAHAEADMVARHPQEVAAEVYLVGHHGSSTSTSTALVAAVQPQLAVYSAARDSPYGHPHVEVVDALVGAGVALYGTPVHGTVVLRGDADGWTVAPEHPAPPITEDPR